ncbi:sporulation membrane protein YtrI [Halalkalibacter urbisdiaboli]|uniref:sporulation membrane protein YtrI n=1 Tax=Halalkalibacter urbisdiaboli TaxID=1960589 RepID=UPI000B42E5C5|nr:sporulation membrane protein YtrI [Halalkalibacter urbisdiaboli]
MRVPPPHLLTGWQRFLAGIVIGALIGWFFFLLHYGQIYGNLVMKMSEQEDTIKDQEKRIDELVSEQEMQNEENKKKLTIQKVEIIFKNERKLKLNKLTAYELKQQALSELTFLERKDIETVSKTKDLMIRTLENKVFQVGESRYQLDIEEIYLFTTVQLYVKIVPASA